MSEKGAYRSDQQAIAGDNELEEQPGLQRLHPIQGWMQWFGSEGSFIQQQQGGGWAHLRIPGQETVIVVLYFALTI